MYKCALLEFEPLWPKDAVRLEEDEDSDLDAPFAGMVEDPHWLITWLAPPPPVFIHIEHFHSCFRIRYGSRHYAAVAYDLHATNTIRRPGAALKRALLMAWALLLGENPAHQNLYNMVRPRIVRIGRNSLLGMPLAP